MSKLESYKALARREQVEFWAGSNTNVADELFAAQVSVRCREPCIG